MTPDPGSVLPEALAPRLGFERMERHVRRALPALFALFFVLALQGVRANGDCREYVLMARAFASHGTPDIRQDDVAWLVAREPFLGRVVAPDALARDDVPATIPHVVRAASGRYYSLHFWLYSLLAAPFIWLCDAASLRPLLALAAVNACAAGALAFHLTRVFRGSWVALAGPALFLLSGPVFYLHFTGPEVLTAAAVLSATLAGWRGEVGLGTFLSAVAASQNPSAGGVLLLVALGRLSYRFGWWQAIFPHVRPRRLDRRELASIALGIGLLLLPYLFFQLKFGLPSLIERFATRRELIGFDRAWSLLFDLNLGIFVGLPGLFAALLVLFALGLSAESPRRAAWLRLSAGVTATFVIMSVPTLSIENWNSGGLVFHRYGTWLAMPWLALVLVALSRLRFRKARVIAGGFVLAQAGVLGTNGLSAEPTLYLQHGALANFALRHFPAVYNPVPEVFIERTLGREQEARPDQPVIWPRTRKNPSKILIGSDQPLTPSRGCQTGQVLAGASETRLRGGFRYVNAPFHCADP